MFTYDILKLFQTDRKCSQLINGVKTHTNKHRPQESWPWGPIGPQKAVHPYWLRHSKGLFASQVEQNALTAFKSQLICGALYKLNVALTLLPLWALDIITRHEHNNITNVTILLVSIFCFVFSWRICCVNAWEYEFNLYTEGKSEISNVGNVNKNGRIFVISPIFHSIMILLCNTMACNRCFFNNIDFVKDVGVLCFYKTKF